MRRIPGTLALSLVCAFGIFGSGTTSRLLGVVQDPTGAAVPSVAALASAIGTRVQGTPARSVTDLSEAGALVLTPFPQFGGGLSQKAKGKSQETEVG